MKRLCLALLALSLVASTAAAQSLADLAKKEEARRKAIKTPSKVYTDGDLKRVAPATPPVAPAAAQTTPAVPPADAREGQPADTQAKTVAEDDPQQTEAYWRNRITEARTRLARGKLMADAMQTRINSLTNDWVARDDPAQRAVLANQRVEALGELQRLQEEIVAQTKAIADIEEEARQAGVPPGWIR
jgi:hypothetical protein